MKKVKIKGLPFKLTGEIIGLNEELIFKVKDLENKDFLSSSISGKKIISVFPDINTKVCDRQTHEISKLAIKNPSVMFLSITNDSVETINKWCQANAISNLKIYSDLEYGDFAKKTNLLIDRINKLARGFILINDSNQITDYVFKEELSSDPDFEKLGEWIQHY